MAKPSHIVLGDGTMVPIVYEDRSVLAIDKPPGWLLAPSSWDRTARNLQLAIESGIQGREHWARSRNLRFLRFVHRLDADTSGVLLLVKSPGAMRAYSQLFEEGTIEKTYLAVVCGSPKKDTWTCGLKISPHPERKGLMHLDAKAGKTAETTFEVLQRLPDSALLLARPRTGRTHQIRLHLQASGYAIMGDKLYPAKGYVKAPTDPLGLRAISLAYHDPFTRKKVHITTDAKAFLLQFGFNPD